MFVQHIRMTVRSRGGGQSQPLKEHECPPISQTWKGCCNVEEQSDCVPERSNARVSDEAIEADHIVVDASICKEALVAQQQVGM